LITDSVARIYSKHLTDFARGRLLDLGCGKAPLYGIYHGLVDSVTCSDWMDSEHVDVVSDLAQPLPFNDAVFDTIILSDVLEHVPDPALVWREMTRVLAPDGHIVMNVPFFYWLHAHPHDFYRYTSFALSRFVSINGLELLRLETLGGVLEVWADLHAKLLTRVPWIGTSLAWLVQSSVSLWGRTQSGQRLAQVSARHFPLGYFVVARKR
jgi:SAM-dependent methyltransferase